MASSRLEQQPIHGNHRSITIWIKKATDKTPQKQRNAGSSEPECKIYIYIFVHIIWFKSELRVNFHVKSKCECKWQTPEYYYILMFEMKHRVEMRRHKHGGEKNGNTEEASQRERERGKWTRTHRLYFFRHHLFISLRDENEKWCVWAKNTSMKRDRFTFRTPLRWKKTTGEKMMNGELCHWVAAFNTVCVCAMAIIFSSLVMLQS